MQDSSNTLIGKDNPLQFYMFSSFKKETLEKAIEYALEFIKTTDGKYLFDHETSVFLGYENGIYSKDFGEISFGRAEVEIKHDSTFEEIKNKFEEIYAISLI